MKLMKYMYGVLALSSVMLAISAEDARAYCKEVVKAQKVVTNTLCARNGNFKGDVQVSGDLTVDGNIIQPNAEVPAPPANNWTNGTMYQIWVPSFFNGGYRTDGLGDFLGIIDKLDYLVDLGVEAIHVTQSAKSNAGLDGFAWTDPFAVDDRWGTEADFINLVDTAHSKGLKVIIGYSSNSYWIDMPWFEAALGGDPLYMERFIFRKNPPFAHNIYGSNIWNSVSDNFPGSVLGQEGGWFYRSRFGFTPDVNVQNPEVLAYQLAAAQAWIDRGVDGFRLEVGFLSVISSVSQEDGTWINDTDAQELWYEQFFGGLREIKSDLIIIPETLLLDRWDYSTKNFAQKGIDAGASYNFQLFGALSDFVSLFSSQFPFFAPINAPDLLKFYSQKLLPLTNQYVDLTLLENHDLGRVMGKYGSDIIPSSLTYTTTATFSPAPANVFRLHVNSEIQFPPQPFGFYYFFYDSTGTIVPSGPYPTAVEITSPPDGIFFLGGGTDAYGPYWDFTIDIVKGDHGSDPRFGGFIVIKNGIKFSDDLVVLANDVTSIIANNKGDAFLDFLGQASLPTADQYNFAQAFNGLLFALPGSPVIFQGEELGMWGNDFNENLRDQLPWDAAQPHQTPLNNYTTVQGPVSSNPLYEYVNDAIHVRRNSPTLRRGTFKVMDLPGNPLTDPVVVYDVDSNSVDSSLTIAFQRTLSGWPTFCIFNFGAPKTIELRPYNVAECWVFDSYQSSSQHSPQVLYSNNVILPTEYTQPSCDPLVMTMGQNSSVVFTFVRGFGVPIGDNNQFAGKCDCK